jgi:hypothetical protein
MKNRKRETCTSGTVPRTEGRPWGGLRGTWGMVLEKRREAAELATEVKAARQIAEIIGEAEAFNLRDAFEKLGNHARRGDKRARERLDKLQEAMLLWW